MSLKPGTVVEGRYRIERRVSAGGMGEVYRARDAVEQTSVALKRMLLNLDPDDREIVERRFAEEVEILRRLDVEGVPRFVDSFVLEGSPCIVMEFIEGDSLEKFLIDYMELSSLPIPEQRVVIYAIRVGYILEALHGMNPPLVHRDVKPANIIVGRENQRVYLVDLGLARGIAAESETTRTLVGTVGYAPIEQFQGRPRPESDQYGLGATMHHLLSGVPPKPLSLPPLLEVAPDVNPELAQIVDRACQMEKEERFPSIFHMRQQLVMVLGIVGGNRLAPNFRPMLGDPSDADTRPVAAGKKTALMEDKVTARVTERFDLDDVHSDKSPLQGLWVPKLLLATLLVVACHFGAGWAYERYASHAAFSFFDPSAEARESWLCTEARGISDGEGLVLRTDDPSLRAGVLFSPLPGGRRVKDPSSFRFRLTNLDGLPTALVFNQPYGVLFEPAGKNYRATLVSVRVPKAEGTSPLNTIAYRSVHQSSYLLKQKDAEALFEVRFQPAGLGSGVELWVEGADQRLLQATIEERAPSGPRECGVVLPVPGAAAQSARVRDFVLVSPKD